MNLLLSVAAAVQFASTFYVWGQNYTWWWSSSSSSYACSVNICSNSLRIRSSIRSNYRNTLSYANRKERKYRQWTVDSDQETEVIRKNERLKKGSENKSMRQGTQSYRYNREWEREREYFFDEFKAPTTAVSQYPRLNMATARDVRFSVLLVCNFVGVCSSSLSFLLF